MAGVAHRAKMTCHDDYCLAHGKEPSCFAQAAQSHNDAMFVMLLFEHVWRRWLSVVNHSC